MGTARAGHLADLDDAVFGCGELMAALPGAPGDGERACRPLPWPRHSDIGCPAVQPS
jgi:hypothetical protein